MHKNLLSFLFTKTYKYEYMLPTQSIFIFIWLMILIRFRIINIFILYWSTLFYALQCFVDEHTDQRGLNIKCNSHIVGLHCLPQGKEWIVIARIISFVSLKCLKSFECPKCFIPMINSWTIAVHHTIFHETVEVIVAFHYDVFFYLHQSYRNLHIVLTNTGIHTNIY